MSVLQKRLKRLFDGAKSGSTQAWTIASFKAVIDGEMDEYPEQAFYMVGGREDVMEKASQMQKAGV